MTRESTSLDQHSGPAPAGDNSAPGDTSSADSENSGESQQAGHRQVPTTLTPPDWREHFIAQYAATGNKQYAAARAGISRRTVYNEIARNEDFAFLVKMAKEEAIQELVIEARRRAMGLPDADGIRQKPSDKLLIFLISSMAPEEFGHGAIVAAQERAKGGSGDQTVNVTINLPENFRGDINIGEGASRKDLFPDAEVVDVPFSETEAEEASKAIESGMEFQPDYTLDDNPGEEDTEHGA